MAEKKKGVNKTQRKSNVQEETLQVGELDQYLFGQGTHYDIYKKLGAHKTKRNGRKGSYLCVNTKRRNGEIFVTNFFENSLVRDVT